jgi:hypothetical protein
VRRYGSRWRAGIFWELPFGRASERAQCPKLQKQKRSRAATTLSRAKRSDPFDQRHPKYPIPNLPFWVPVTNA